MQNTIDRLRARRANLEDREGGFTLIELLIVIVILGILAAIVVFAVQNLTGQSAKASCGSDFKTVETAMETYKAQVGHYPQVGDAAQNSPTDNTAVVLAASAAGSGTVAANNGLSALYSAQTGVDGSQVGPWLKDVPKNGSLYTVYASVGTNASPSVGAGNVAVSGQQSTVPAGPGVCK
jgi:general secretion pathway protein G